MQKAFEFLNTLTISKKSVRNVFNQNGQSDRDGERTKSNGGRRGNQGKAEQTEQKNGPSTERPCLICGAYGHWVKDFLDADKDESETSSKKEKNRSKKRTSLLALPADILDNHGLSDVSELLERGAGEAPRQVTVGDSVLLESSSLKDNGIVLDSGGSTSIFKNASLGATETHISDDMFQLVEQLTEVELSRRRQRWKHSLDLSITLRIVWRTSCHTRK